MVAATTQDKREKIYALSLTKECYSMKQIYLLMLTDLQTMSGFSVVQHVWQLARKNMQAE
jgi:hypothetical protein